MIKKKVELLAPAGSLEAYEAAVAAGADAVYLGAKAFNARQQAANFDNGILSEVIKDAHIRGVKIYVVLNTLITDKELKEAAELASFVCNEGIDGIIVQDFGMVNILKKIAPEVPIHASTQMTIHNTDGVRAAQTLGIKRVVLARELSISEIEKIIRETGVEAEVFIHGALCICRSGQCLLSSFIGGRSGNRGRCAQPCRLPYKIEGINTSGAYLLSPKDLMSLELLPDIINAGVASLKIEGRMKSPEYVAATVMIYRKYLDLAQSSPSEYKVDYQDIRMLQQVFNRGGFTTGYLKGKDRKLLSMEHPKHWGMPAGTVVGQDKQKYFGSRDNKLIAVKLNDNVSIGDGLEIWDSETPSAIISVMMREGKHVKNAGPGDTVLLGNFRSYAKPGSPVYKTYDKKLMEYLSAVAAKKVPTVPVRGEFRLFVNEKPSLTVTDYDQNKVHIEGREPSQEARGTPVSEERICEQLKKTGDTPYYFDYINVFTDGKSFIPVSLINEMRRDALRKLSEKRAKVSVKFTVSEKEDFPGTSQTFSAKRKISLMFYRTPPALEWENIPADRVYLGTESFDKLEEVQNAGIEAFAAIPAVLTDTQMDMVVGRIASLRKKPDGILAGNLGALHRTREEFPDIPVVLDYTMNIFNSPSIELLSRYKPSGIMPSLELNFEALEEIKPQNIPLEAYVYGMIPVMTLEYCPGSNNGQCSGKCGICENKQGYLTDRRGKKFLYRTNPVLNRTTIYNSSILMLDDVTPFEKTGVKILRIGIMDEDPETVRDLCRFYRSLWIDEKDESTVDIDGLLPGIKEKSLTRGHYYRGVE